MDEGGKQVGLHARLMSYALRRLTAAIAKSNTTVIFINQLRAQISSGYSQGPTETTTGGRALKFYSSVRIEVARGKQVTRGDEVIGHELYIKVVKTNRRRPSAPPTRRSSTAKACRREWPCSTWRSTARYSSAKARG